MPKKTVILVVLDGWGIGRDDETNPMHEAKMPHFEWLKDNFPMTSLQASGISVGLPWGEVGNSEVGHLTLGAGKTLYQYYPKIMMAIKDKSFFQNPAFVQAFDHAKKNNAAVNLIGLLSTGNVHASLEHLQALIRMGEERGVPVKLHLFADGKDCHPKSILDFLKQIPKDKLATLMGRYYGMDRNKNWSLTETAYRTLTGDAGKLVTDPLPELEATFAQGLTEEYLPALKLKEDAGIHEHDAVIFFNYREDSIRQIAESFILKDFKEFAVKGFQDVFISTMTRYEDRFPVPVAFEADVCEKPLGLVVADAGKNQIRIAESYKYAHVTYFFNGLREEPFKNEYRALVPSLSIPKPETHPELMARPITDRLIEALQGLAFNFILVNYANGDAIAHTANFDASVKAIEVVDEQIGRLLEVAIQEDVALLITADHGNVEQLLNPLTSLPESQHDFNPVPCYLVAPEFRGRKFLNWQNIVSETMGSLADVAPTILELFGIPQPKEMTGHSLLEGLI